MSPYTGIGFGNMSPVVVCGGCRVESFGPHRCYGEVVTVLAVGQAVVNPCACQVETGCAGYIPPAEMTARQSAPFNYRGVAT